MRRNKKRTGGVMTVRPEFSTVLSTALMFISNTMTQQDYKVFEEEVHRRWQRGDFDQYEKPTLRVHVNDDDRDMILSISKRLSGRDDLYASFFKWLYHEDGFVSCLNVFDKTIFGDFELVNDTDMVTALTSTPEFLKFSEREYIIHNTPEVHEFPKWVQSIEFVKKHPTYIRLKYDVWLTEDQIDWVMGKLRQRIPS